MRDRILNIYVAVFGRPQLIKLNRFLFHAAIRAMGLLNYRNEKLNGEKAFLTRFLKAKKNPRVLDVGANVGNYAREVLHINPKTELHCFEPHPRTFEKLQRNVNDVSNRVNFVNMGVSDIPGKVLLHDYADSPGSSHASMYEGVIETVHHQESEAIEVEVTDLNTYFQKHNIDHVDILKIDTEGNELNVLKGLGKHLDDGTIRIIHFEFNEMNIFSRTTFKDFWSVLSKYQLYRLLPYGRMLKFDQYIPVECELYCYQNIIAKYRS